MSFDFIIICAWYSLIIYCAYRLGRYSAFLSMSPERKRQVAIADKEICEALDRRLKERLYKPVSITKEQCIGDEAI